MLNNEIDKLKMNIFARAKIFIENLKEFAPFGTKLIDGQIKEIVFYHDETETFNTVEILKIIEKNLLEELNNKKIQAAAIAYDVSANFKNSDGISEKRDALCMKISTNGITWTDEYFPYMLIDGECVWR